MSIGREWDMKRVIVYGVKNIKVRRDIEYFLDEDYQIIGYSDGHYSCDVLDGKTFFHPEELCRQEYDFILLTPQAEKTQKEIRGILSALGVPPDKIVRPLILREGDRTRNHSDVITNIESRYKGEPGLIFGMSYSYFGIYEQELKTPFFNCSYSGLDIYYNYRVYQYMKVHGLSSKIEKVLLVIPYYYFDFDMSRASGEYEGGYIFSMRRLDDWHNYRKVECAPEYVENYHMFGKKFSRYYHVPMWKEPTNYVYETPDGTSMMEPLWFDEHKETEEENRRIFARFYQELEAGGRSICYNSPVLFRRRESRVKNRCSGKKRTILQYFRGFGNGAWAH